MRRLLLSFFSIRDSGGEWCLCWLFRVVWVQVVEFGAVGVSVECFGVFGGEAEAGLFAGVGGSGGAFPALGGVGCAVLVGVVLEGGVAGGAWSEAVLVFGEPA